MGAARNTDTRMGPGRGRAVTTHHNTAAVSSGTRQMSGGGSHLASIKLVRHGDCHCVVIIVTAHHTVSVSLLTLTLTHLASRGLVQYAMILGLLEWIMQESYSSLFTL